MVYLFVKRFFDIVFSALALLVLSPILVPIVIGLRLTGEGEILYLQKRVGFRNRLFDIWKFATMLKNSPNIGTGAITLRRDPRVLPMGGFLRKTKINELPQLVNILKGDMSFVGPRPLMKVSFEQYSQAVQAVVYNVKPGLTGIGSTIFRDEERWVSESGMDPQAFYTQFIFPHKGAVELWYQKNQSFLTDFKILFLTAWAIVAPTQDLTAAFFPTLPSKPKALSA